jgi:glutamate/tyrosine decarboxylase-like PLP-dependent enzyme
MPAAEVERRLRALVFEQAMYPGHPRFMAYISGAGTLPGVVGDFIAAMINQNVGGFRLAPAATEIELFVARWFAEQFGLPSATAGGLLVSGGAMANFVALKAARDAIAGTTIRKLGVGSAPPLAIYASEQVHDVIDRAADMLGLGTDAVRKIPVDSRYRMRPEALTARIAEDRRAGIKPCAIVGTAGTVSTGAIDPLPALADIAQTHGIWFHVDGAYGALAALSPGLKPLLRGLERADSIAFDPHKWLYVPHSAGCVVVRDTRRLADAFALHPAYVHEDKARTGAGADLHVFGPQFSRGFQALKVWLSLVAHGSSAYGRRIAHDVALARYMAGRVQQLARLELMAPVDLSICCFRYVPDDLTPSLRTEPYLNDLNDRLFEQVQRDGRAFCSNAVLGGRNVLRACIVNFRTEAGDVEALLDVVRELGAALDRELRPQSNLRG